MNPLKSDERTDEQLLKETLEGKLTSFEILVRRYQQKIFSHCQRLLGDEQLAEDAAQETFIKVFEKADQFDFSKKFASWLYRIATNTAWDHWRKNKKVIKSLSDKVIEDKDFLWENLEQKDLCQLLKQALKKLPANYRKVLEYYYFEEKNYSEISQAMGVPINTVRTWIKRGKEKMREIYSSLSS